MRKDISDDAKDKNCFCVNLLIVQILVDSYSSICSSNSDKYAFTFFCFFLSNTVTVTLSYELITNYSLVQVKESHPF